MNTTTKRHLISFIETFSSAFIAVLWLQIDWLLNKIVETWTLPTKEILVGIILASTVAGTKAIIKPIREYLFNFTK